MSAYNNLEPAILGLEADVDTSRVESKVASEDINFGVPLFANVGNENGVSLLNNDTAKLVLSTDLIASNSTIVTVNGVATTATVYASDHATTMAAIVTKLNALSGVKALLDTSDNKIIWIKAVDTDIVATAVTTLGSTQPSWTITYTTQMIFVGVAKFIQKYITGSANSSKYYTKDVVSNLVNGEIWVQASKAVNANDEAYIIASGATKGQFTDVSTSNYDCTIRFKSSTTGAGLVKVSLNGYKRPATEIAFA